MQITHCRIKSVGKNRKKKLCTQLTPNQNLYSRQSFVWRPVAPPAEPSICAQRHRSPGPFIYIHHGGASRRTATQCLYRTLAITCHLLVDKRDRVHGGSDIYGGGSARQKGEGRGRGRGEEEVKEEERRGRRSRINRNRVRRTEKEEEGEGKAKPVLVFFSPLIVATKTTTLTQP